MDAPQYPDLILLAIPFFVLSLVIEGFVVKRMKDQGRDVIGHTVKDTVASLSMGLGNLFVGLVWKGIAFALYLALYQLTPLRMGFGLGAWVLIFFGDDLCDVREFRDPRGRFDRAHIVFVPSGPAIAGAGAERARDGHDLHAPGRSRHPLV